MIKPIAAVLFFALAVNAFGTDDKSVTARINELQKQLSSRSEKERIDAIGKLGDILHSKSRSLLAKKLVSDTDKVRLAAAEAIIKHRHDVCAKALGLAIQSARGNQKLIKSFIKSLGDLDMCVGVPILVAVLQRDSKLAKDCLAAITRIGCVEAAPGMIKMLGMAEKEAKKPDSFPGIGDVNDRNRRNRTNDRNRTSDRTENVNKDKDLAAFVKPVRDALKKLTGKSFKNHEAWLGGARAGSLSRRQVKVYFCEHARKRFDVASGDRVTCPFEDAPSRHKDHFQKHRGE